MILTRGPQGSGKSTMLRELGLESYAISADAIRQMLSAPVMTRSGALSVSQEHEPRVWSQLHTLLGERMERGELVAVDATHRKAADFRAYRELAHAHRYQMLCVDFRDVPLARCLEQNAARAEHLVVPPATLVATHEACLLGEIPADVPSVRWSGDGAHREAARRFLDVPIRDLNTYRAVMHVGDLQGCASPLEALYPSGLDEDVFHVFVGDFCDRGPENAEALRWILDVADRPNVALIWGNHEEHLHHFARGLPATSDEFGERTQPALEAAGITPEEVDALCDRLVDVVLYEWRGERVMVCHAGLPSVPTHPVQISSKQWQKGVGFYDTHIDPLFDAHAPDGWTQVRGHRNPQELPVKASERSFVLEGQVEQGGHLRALRLDADGFHPIAIRNRVFRSARDRLAQGILRDTKIYPKWVASQDEPTIPVELVDALREHPLVAEKRDPERPYLAAFNFTRDAFFDRRWDALNVTARGLFVDVERGTIVARSYDKFFNVGERPETQMAALADMRFPVTAWVKENGYLGIIGFDDFAGELVFASKSSLQSEFAGWLRELATRALGPSNLEKLRRYLRDAQGTAVFEVIDPVRDPHIIAYDGPRLVLLDVVRRAADFERLHPEALHKLGKRLGLETKAKEATLPNFEAFRAFCARTNEPDWTWSGQPLEGFVFEDAAGFQVKLKLDYYAFWKRMRGLKDRVQKQRAKGGALGRDVSEPRVAHFYEWLCRQADEVLAAGIVEVRALYLAGVETPLEPPEPGEDPDVRGFVRALEGLSAALEAGVAIKPGTAEKLLVEALEHGAKMTLLAASALKVPLVVIAPASDTRRDAADRLGVDVD